MLELLKYAYANSLISEERYDCGFYQANKVAKGLNLLTFFIADDKIDLSDLQKYRNETQTECLIAINTSNKAYECLNIADSVVYCSPNEVELAIYGLAFMALGYRYFCRQ